jgi:hypothetical protein
MPLDVSQEMYAWFERLRISVTHCSRQKWLSSVDPELARWVHKRTGIDLRY